MRRLTPILLLLALLAAAPPAAAGGPAHTIADFAWLAGDWRGTLAGGDLSHEVWSPPAGGEMMGMWRWVAADGVRLYEFFTLAVEDVPVLRLRHFSRELAPWASEAEGPLTLRLVAAGPREATFAGVEGGKPVRLTYRRPAADELEVVLAEAGGESTFRYRLHR